MRWQFIIILFLGMFWSCKNPTQPETTNPIQISLKYGESKMIKPFQLRVGFQEVLSDSRCPMNVVCVWEGRAEIRLWLIPSKADTVFITSSIFGYVDKTDTLRHTAVDTAGFQITLIQLDPYPVAGVDVQKEAYVALLEILKP